MSISGQAESLSSLHWTDQIAAAPLTRAQLQVPTQCYAPKARAGSLLHLQLLLCAPPPWLALAFLLLLTFLLAFSGVAFCFGEENLLR